MVYPKRIDWNGRISGHPQGTRRSQRDLVAASLMCVPADRIRWDERRRVEYRTRVR